MRRVNLFLTVLIVCLAALVALTVIGFAIFSSAQNPYNWMSQMWGGSGTQTGGMMGGGGMMGQTGQTTTSINTSLTYFGIIYAVFIGLIIVGIVGLTYYIVYPQIRMGTTSTQPLLSQQSPNVNSPYESVSKTLTEEERKIIQVLNNHDGKYLQKYIRTETGLSRLKTHRILARLAERGIVTLEKTGNTNQVVLANWLQNKN